jgi:hypothetical protein
MLAFSKKDESSEFAGRNNHREDPKNPWATSSLRSRANCQVRSLEQDNVTVAMPIAEHGAASLKEWVSGQHDAAVKALGPWLVRRSGP